MDHLEIINMFNILYPDSDLELNIKVMITYTENNVTAVETWRDKNLLDVTPPWSWRGITVTVTATVIVTFTVTFTLSIAIV